MDRKTGALQPELHDEPVMIGEVARPHGIHGELKVYLFSGQPENFKQYKKIIMRQPAGGTPETYHVLKCREQGKQLIVRLQGVETREAAEALQGSGIWLNRDDFPELDPQEYYWHQLQGLQVETENGRALGRVARLFNTTAHDIMVVSGAGQEYMIPVRGDIIRSIDRQKGKILICPPPGLLEMNK